MGRDRAVKNLQLLTEMMMEITVKRINDKPPAQVSARARRKDGISATDAKALQLTGPQIVHTLMAALTTVAAKANHLARSEVTQLARLFRNSTGVFLPSSAGPISNNQVARHDRAVISGGANTRLIRDGVALEATLSPILNTYLWTVIAGPLLVFQLSLLCSHWESRR